MVHVYGSHDMRHVDFRGLTGCQQTPQVWGFTAKGLAMCRLGGVISAQKMLF